MEESTLASTWTRYFRMSSQGGEVGATIRVLPRVCCRLLPSMPQEMVVAALW